MEGMVMIKRITQIEKGKYQTPSCEIVELHCEQIVCESVVPDTTLEDLADPEESFPW